MRLYKRNAQGNPIIWDIEDTGSYLHIKHGLVGGKLHEETISKTLVKANEYDSRIKAKRKEGYKEFTELKDSNVEPNFAISGEISAMQYNNKDNINWLIHYLNTYLPKYSTTSEGFVLPMLAKTLEDNKPFEKNGTMLGQWKINGLRCIIGAEKNIGDLFTPIKFTYTSREGTRWNLSWFDNILQTYLHKELIDAMIEEGICLDGELYLPGYSVNDINSFVKNSSLPQHYKLQYWWYDICIENMSAVKRSGYVLSNSSTLVKYFDTKQEHLNNNNPLVVLPSFAITNITEAIKWRDKFVNIGFEGLIVRNKTSEYQFGKRNSAMFKFKHIDDGLFDVVSINEDKRGLPVYTLRNDINNELFECTINLPQDKQRQQLEIKHLLIGKKAFVEFRERSGVKQVPFHAKIIKIII